MGPEGPAIFRLLNLAYNAPTTLQLRVWRKGGTDEESSTAGSGELLLVVHSNVSPVMFTIFASSPFNLRAACPTQDSLPLRATLHHFKMAPGIHT